MAKQLEQTIGKNGHPATGNVKRAVAKAARAKAKAARECERAPESAVATGTVPDHASASTPTFPARPTLRQRQSALKLKYRVRPDAALITSAVASVTGPGVDPSRVRIAIEGPSGAVLEIGAHHGVGGTGDIPCSGDIFLASLAGCQELTIRLVAAALSLPIHRLDVRVEGDWDVRGTLAIDREAPIGFTAIRVNVDLETDGAPDRIERLLTSAERYCVVGATLHTPPPVTFTANVTHPDMDA